MIKMLKRKLTELKDAILGTNNNENKPKASTSPKPTNKGADKRKTSVGAKGYNDVRTIDERKVDETRKFGQSNYDANMKKMTPAQRKKIEQIKTDAVPHVHKAMNGDVLHRTRMGLYSTFRETQVRKQNGKLFREGVIR